MSEGNPPRTFYFVDTQNFKALVSVGATPVILPHDVGEVANYLDTVDGVLVTGGGYQFDDAKLFRNDGSEPAEKVARTQFEVELIRQAVARNKPLLAVCGGFQTLNFVTGGDLVVSLKAANPAWERHRGSSFLDLAHGVNVSPDSCLASIVGVEKFQVNTRHQQGVVRTGEQARVSGMCDDDVIEAIEIADRRFCIGVQWHPEFFLTDADRKLFEAFVEASRA